MRGKNETAECKLTADFFTLVASGGWFLFFLPNLAGGKQIAAMAFFSSDTWWL